MQAGDRMQDMRGSDLDWLAFCYVAGELTAADAERFEQRLAAEQAACEAVARAVELAQVSALAVDAVHGGRIARLSSETARWRRATWICGSIAAATLVMLAVVAAVLPPSKIRWLANSEGASIRNGHVTGLSSGQTSVAGSPAGDSPARDSPTWMIGRQSPELAVAWAQSRIDLALARAELALEEDTGSDDGVDRFASIAGASGAWAGSEGERLADSIEFQSVELPSGELPGIDTPSWMMSAVASWTQVDGSAPPIVE